jgi:hypothetical protein
MFLHEIGDLVDTYSKVRDGISEPGQCAGVTEPLCE